MHSFSGVQARTWSHTYCFLGLLPTSIPTSIPTSNPIPIPIPTLPTDDPSRKKLGAFLVQTQLQGSVNSSAMFLTAAAQNLLCMKLAAEMGVAIAAPWVTWVKVRGAGGLGVG